MAKRKKGVKGQPAIYEEFKERVNISLTPTAIAYLDAKAAKEGISRSELVERIARTLGEDDHASANDGNITGEID